MPNYELQRMTAGQLQDVEQNWKTIAGVDEFEVELAVVFEWASSRLEPATGSSHALALVNETTSATDALLEIIDADRGRMTKLLTLYPSPSFWDVPGSVTRKMLTDLYTGAIANVLDLGRERRTVQDIKIYGRSAEMLELLKHIKDVWGDTVMPGWDVSMQGRWLAVVYQGEEPQ